MVAFWNKSLVAKLISSFLLLSLVLTGVAGLVAFIQATNALERSVVERLQVAALARQDELTMWVSTQANDLTFVARWEELVEPATTLMNAEQTSLDYQVAYTTVAETLRDVVVRRPDFAELLLLDNAGSVVVSSQRSSEGQDLSQSNFYIVGQNQTFIQNVYPAPETQIPTMTIATPLLDSLGRRIGVLAVHLNLDRLERIILERAGLGSTGEVYLIDKTGAFVAVQRFEPEALPDHAHSEGIERALAGESGTGRYRNYRGVPVIGSYQWLDDLELALLVEMEEAEAFAPTRRLALNITLASIIAAGLLIFGIQFLARQIARPVLQLTEAARSVAEGNLETTAPVMTRDEIGVLAGVFNQMTTQLRGLYERMEQKVADRTAELTEANEQLTSEIAERKRIEAQLWQAKEDAEAANRAKSAFLANMSHELRTPLSAIIGFAQLLQRHQATPREHQEYLHIMTRSSEHLRDLINGVLNMSKIEAGRITLDTTEVDLQFVLDEITSMFRLGAHEKSLTLRLECAPDVPSHLATDEGKLRQILINLVGNAIKFTHEGHIIIRVSVAGAATAHPLLHIEVEDSGPGIASEDSEQVFSPFYQTATTRNHAQGTGLGLPISRQYARLMGGDIILESNEGGGSTFRLVLPLAVSAPDEPPGSATTEEQPQQRVVGIAAGEPTYRILVAEDSDDGRLLLVDLLESVGFAVRGVPDGKACVEQWAAWQPHLIWMDIRMPEMDGFEATRRIKSSEQGQQTVIIALTASAFEEDRARILAAGCDDFVRKPFRDSDIFEHMAKHLGVQYQYELVEPVLQENGYPV